MWQTTYPTRDAPLLRSAGRGAASFRKRNRAEITTLLCEQKHYPIRFSCWRKSIDYSVNIALDKSACIPASLVHQKVSPQLFRYSQSLHCLTGCVHFRDLQSQVVLKVVKRTRSFIAVYLKQKYRACTLQTLHLMSLKTTSSLSFFCRPPSKTRDTQMATRVTDDARRERHGLLPSFRASHGFAAPARVHCSH